MCTAKRKPIAQTTFRRGVIIKNYRGLPQTCVSQIVICEIRDRGGARSKGYRLVHVYM